MRSGSRCWLWAGPRRFPGPLCSEGAPGAARRPRLHLAGCVYVYVRVRDPSPTSVNFDALEETADHSFHTSIAKRLSLRVRAASLAPTAYK